MAELADAYDSKSYGKPYGFESHQRHHFFSIYYHIVQKYLQSFLDNRMFYLKGFFYFIKLYSFKTNHSARMCTSKHSLKIKAAAIATAQTVDKAGAGDNLQHHFSIKNNFSFISRKIV